MCLIWHSREIPFKSNLIIFLVILLKKVSMLLNIFIVQLLNIFLLIMLLWITICISINIICSILNILLLALSNLINRFNLILTFNFRWVISKLIKIKSLRLMLFDYLLVFLRGLERIFLYRGNCLFPENFFLGFFHISPCFILIVLIFIINDLLLLNFFFLVLIILICVCVGSAVAALNYFSWWANGCYLLGIRRVLLW